MSSLTFLIIRSAKNSLLELRRKPGKLVLYIFVLLVLGGVIAVNIFLPNENDSLTDIVYLKGIAFAFFLLSFVTAVNSGLSKGSTLFGMDDVNLLFVSPVNPRSILLYGIIRMVKTMALTSIFILFQGGNLRTFGVKTGGLAVLYSGYLLTAVVSQILGLFIYSTTNGRSKRQRLVKILAVLLFVPLIIYAVPQFISADGDYLKALHSILSLNVLSFTPVTGWSAAGIIAFMTGDVFSGILFFGLLFLTGAVLVAVIYIGKPDYYEDVLVASETAFEQKRNLAEGKVNSLEQNSNRRVRIKGTGISGWGASAFLYKHLRESFRANRFGLWGFPTLILTAGAACFILVMKNAIGSDGDTEIGPIMMLTMLGTLMWMQIFFVGMGRGLKETYSHYIYVIPENPFKKMVWSNLEIMIKAFVEGALICSVSGIVAEVGFAVTLLSVAVYMLFIFMLIGVNYVSMRFTGADMSAGLLVMLYMFAVLLVMLPGIVLAVVAGVSGGGVTAALAVLAGWELAASLVCFWLSKGILHNCDMAVMRYTGHN